MNYDFIEIGTSDFNTLIQKADDNVIGLSIEPIFEYLQRLPNRKHITKVNCAVSNESGTIEIFFIPDHIRKENNLPTWMKGTNSVGEPHKTVINYLLKHNLPLTLVQIQIVQVYSIKELFEKYNVKSVGYLKIDTEGYDCIIMNSYLDLVEINLCLNIIRKDERRKRQMCCV